MQQVFGSVSEAQIHDVLEYFSTHSIESTSVRNDTPVRCCFCCATEQQPTKLAHCLPLLPAQMRAAQDRVNALFARDSVFSVIDNARSQYCSVSRSFAWFGCLFCSVQARF